MTRQDYDKLTLALLALGFTAAFAFSPRPDVATFCRDAAAGALAAYYLFIQREKPGDKNG